MSEADEWRGHITELREVAEQTVDAERHQKLLDLADEWEKFAKELGEANVVFQLGQETLAPDVPNAPCTDKEIAQAERLDICRRGAPTDAAQAYGAATGRRSPSLSVRQARK